MVTHTAEGERSTQSQHTHPNTMNPDQKVSIQINNQMKLRDSFNWPFVSLIILLRINLITF